MLNLKVYTHLVHSQACNDPCYLQILNYCSSSISNFTYKELKLYMLIKQEKVIRSCFFALEDYLFLYADLWELKYSSSGCQLNSYQGGGLQKRGRRVSCHAGIIIVAAGETNKASATVYYLIELQMIVHAAWLLNGV